MLEDRLGRLSGHLSPPPACQRRQALRSHVAGGHADARPSKDDPIVALGNSTRTVAPGEISEELMPTVEALGLVENCRQLGQQGWTIVRDAASPEFVARLRETTLRLAGQDPYSGGNVFAALAKDDAYAEAALNPKAAAMAEFSVGRGNLIGNLIGTTKTSAMPKLGLHADQAMVPAPFPAHNMMLTCCWTLDDFTKDNGCTFVLPGSMAEMRHPTAAESAEQEEGVVAIECPAGSLVLWDGRVWHGSFPRQAEGKRVALHVTYNRLLMRPIEAYSDEQADALCAKWGKAMSTLLGREDYLQKASLPSLETFSQTMLNVRS